MAAFFVDHIRLDKTRLFVKPFGLLVSPEIGRGKFFHIIAGNHAFKQLLQRFCSDAPILVFRIDRVIPQEEATLGVFAEHRKTHHVVAIVDIESRTLVFIIFRKDFSDGFFRAKLFLLFRQKIDFHFFAWFKSHAFIINLDHVSVHSLQIDPATKKRNEKYGQDPYF